MTYIVPATPELEQGDVFDDCPVGELLDHQPPGGEYDVRVIAARVVVLTQTCDLVQGKAARVVVAVIHTAEKLVSLGLLKSATIRDQVRTGKTYGWYFLPEATSELDLKESLVDLRDLHTVPVSILADLVARGKRLGRLATPYREHLAQHFAVTYMRIALPEPYETRP